MKNYWYTLQFDDFKLNQLIPRGKERKMPGGGDFLSIGKHFASLLDGGLMRQNRQIAKILLLLKNERVLWNTSVLAKATGNPIALASQTVRKVTFTISHL